MKRKIISVLLVLAMAVMLLQPVCSITALADSSDIWDGTVAESYAGGNGTSGNPYLISTASQLARLLGVDMAGVTNSEGKYYRLTDNIYLNDTSSADWTESARAWYTTSEWLEYSFRGTFDGDGHVISGIYINNSGDNRSGGLFPSLRDTATVKNLGIINSSITMTGAGSSAGAIAGITDGNFEITSCFAASTVSVSAATNAAGILGKICGSSKTLTVENVYSLATLSATNCFGIVAYQWPIYTGTISNVYTVDYDVFANNHGQTITNENEYSNVKTQSYLMHENLENKLNMAGSVAAENMNFDFVNVWAVKGGKYPYLRIFGDTYADGLYTGTPGAVWDGSVAECYDDGDGTAAHPYLISTAAQLALLVGTDVNNTTGKYYKLTENIILNDGTTSNKWNYSSSLSCEYAFKGTFDGDGHIVSGINISNSTKNRVGGLFQTLGNGATIKNLGIINSTISFTGDGSYAGALAGAAKGDFTIDKCFVAGSVSVSATGYVAGFIGNVGCNANPAGTLSITDCYSMATLSGTTNAFGLFGYNWPTYSGTVSRVYTVDHDLFKNDMVGQPTTVSYEYSNTCVNSGYRHTNLWHKEYMRGDAAKYTYMTGLDFDNVWDVSANKYPWLRIFGSTYADGIYTGVVGQPFDGRLAGGYDGGSGTADSPYLISTAAQLAMLIETDNGSTADKFYKLTANIVLNDTSADNWTQTAYGWYTTSTALEYNFAGTFDGDGHTVSGLYINNSDDNRMGGVFPSLSGTATVKNLGIVNSSVTMSGATTFAGALAGGTDGNFTLSQCFADSTVSLSATNQVAGLVGKVDSGAARTVNIENCYSTAVLSGTADATNRYGLFAYQWRSYTGSVKNVYTVGHDLFCNDGGTIATDNEYSNVKEHNWFTHTNLFNTGNMTGFEAIRYMANFDWDIWAVKPGGLPYLRIFTGESHLFGDVNCDQEIDVFDLVKLKKYYALSNNNLDIANDIIRKSETGSYALKSLISSIMARTKNSQEFSPQNGSLTGYVYKWGDEFNGIGLDSSIWSFLNQNSSDGIVSSTGVNYVNVQDGTLKLGATRKVSGETVTYTAAPWINSNDGMNFKYGYVEMRAKIPLDKGAFPSFWMSAICGAGKNNYKSLVKGDCNDYGAEVDAMEFFGSNSTKAVWSSMHKWYTGADHKEIERSTSGDGYYLFTAAEQSQYHIFGYEWTPSYIKMYVDGNCYATYDITASGNFDLDGHTTDMSGFHDPQYLRLGNMFKTEKFKDTDGDVTTEYLIDWIRLYQKDDGVSKLYTGE